MYPYRRLLVWQRSHRLAVAIYELSKSFPDNERFGLVSQLRRAAYSIPTNLAEGSKRLSKREFAHFVNISEGSAGEAEYLLELCAELGFPHRDECLRLQAETNDIARMLCAFRVRLTG